MTIEMNRKNGLIYELFQTHGVEGAEAILAENNVKMKKDTESDKWILIYDTMKCANSNEYGRKCRGIIVDRDGVIVARKFDRFFNYNEMLDITGQVDYSRAKYYPKEDGSLISIWFDTDLDKWRISTKATVDGKGVVKNGNKPYKLFDELVYQTLGTTEAEFTDKMNKACGRYVEEFKKSTLIFELCTKENKVITDYPSDKMVLLWSLKNHPEELSLVWFHLSWFAEQLQKVFTNVELVEEIKGIETKEQALEHCKKLGTLNEGLIIFDPVTRIRIKMKNPLYVWVANVKDEGVEPTLSKLAEIVYHGEVDEFAAYFPEWKDKLELVRDLVTDTYRKLEQAYVNMPANTSGTSREEMAEFARVLRNYVPNNYFQKLFFKAKRNNQTFQEAFKDSDIRYYVGFFEEAFKELPVS